ncbi:MAG TPA: fibronectin type III domain-containing protein [Bryobacteraceae bacterium]|jgi:hypothetical protein|nr:fibronectin type III domain-containing protein [Bryobacteraceae bacterium]
MSRPGAGIAFLTLIPALSAAGWNADLRVSGTGVFTHAGQLYASSSSLSVSWTPPPDPVTGFVIVAVSKRSAVRLEAEAGATGAVLENLKAGTTYKIRLRACSDARCDEFIESDDEVTASTEEEYWRIQGTGSSFATASRLATDGNVGSYAFRYGPWAGPERDGRIQLYYNPLQMDEKGVKIGEMIAPLADSIEAASSFRGVSGYGLQRVCIPSAGPPGSGPPPPDPACAASGSLATQLALFQAVPMDSEAGALVRLYFEAQGFDVRTRILWLDSQDGYAGRDFNAGPASRCNTLRDYSAGGGCEPKLAVGVDIDGDQGNPNLLNARQFKIGYPTLDSWL